MIVTDLDGTLLNSQRQISLQDQKALLQLKERGHIRTLCTGRSLHSIAKVLPKETPFSHVIFCSGAGIVEWETGNLIYKTAFNKEKTTEVLGLLEDSHLDFMAHFEIPENHHYVYKQFSKENPDFHSRLGFSGSLAQPFPEVKTDRVVTHFLVILPLGESGEEEVARIRTRCPELEVWKIASPLDRKSQWIEIFPPGVHKGSGVKQLASLLGYKKKIWALGNDYNDIEMLKTCDESFVVKNASEDIRCQFRTVADNDHSGFSEFAHHFLEESDLACFGAAHVLQFGK